MASMSMLSVTIFKYMCEYKCYSLWYGTQEQIDYLNGNKVIRHIKYKRIWSLWVRISGCLRQLFSIGYYSRLVIS